MAGTSRLKKIFDDYSSYHRTRGNQVTHYLGIPLIVVTLMGLLSNLVIPLPGLSHEALIRLDGGILLWAGASAWYLWLDWHIGAPFAVSTLGGYFLGRSIPWAGLWSLQVLGWIFQGIGHAVYEKKSPAFLKNIEHLLVGPIWIFSKLVGYAR